MAVEGFIENSSVSSIAYDDAEHSATLRSDTATTLPHDQQQKLAQVETNQSAGALSAATATQPGDRTILVEENVAELPSGTSIETIEIDGDNLVLVQPDGTRVIIENAALHVPTFVMDNVEIPQEALVAALEASNINVAAGPDGTLTATAAGSTSGGGNFGEAIPGIGDAGPPIDLLGPTALQFGTLDDEILTPAFVNRGPSIRLDGGGSGSAGSIAASDRLVYEHDLPAGSAMSRFSTFAPQQFSFASENEDGSASSEGASGSDATVDGVFLISDPDGLSDIAGIGINGINVAPGDIAGKTFAGVYGTLTIVSFNATTGEAVYSYTLTKAYHSADGGNGPNTEQDRDIFSLTVTDRGGLSASANLRIDIVDDVPQIRGQAYSELPQAGVDETDFDGDASIAAGDFFDGLSYTFGADGPGAVTYKLELSADTSEGGIRSGLYALDNTVDGGQGAEIMLRQEGLVIYGDAGGKTYFTITLDKGVVVLDQVTPNAIWHENTDNPDDRQSLRIENGSLMIVATVTDGDGDRADYGIELGSGVFTFDDDGPQVTAQANRDFSVIHDESPLPQGEADDILFTSIFSSVANPGEDPQSPRLLPWLARLPLGYAQSATSALTVTGAEYGADGEAKTGAKVFSLTLLDVNGDTASSIDSGLETTEHRQIFLFKEGNLIVGRYDGGDNGSDVSNTGQTPDPAAFAIHIDPNTGIVSMVQYVSLFNNDPNNSDDSISLVDTVGRVEAMVTVTDGDGDTATAKADIGGSIVFQDDGPHIIGVDVQSRFAVTADETTGNQTNTDDVTGPLAVFANVANVGSDPDRSGQPLALAQESRAALNVLPYFGVDGPAAKDSIVFSLALKGGNGTASGLKVTDGTAILLYEEGGIIVGRIGSEEGKAAFAIAIDPESGKVSVVEYLSLQHNLDGLNPNDQVSLQADTLLATVTIKDGDGDTDSASADISGRIQFNDDGPTFTVSTGGTTPLSSIALNLDETIGTRPDRYNTDEQPRDNNGTVDDTASTTVTYTTDATSTAQIGHLNTTAGLLANLFVAPIATTVDYGADGKGTFSATLGFVLTGPADGGFKTNLVVTAVNGSPLANASAADRTVWLTVEGNHIIGRVGHDTQTTDDDYIAFRISLSSTDPAAAQLIVDQFLPIDHGGSENPSVFDEQISLLMANAGQGVGLQLTVTATDGDNDTLTQSATVPLIGKESSFVSFDDDGPSIAASDARETVNVTYTGIKAGHVDERGMEGQNGGDVLLSGIGSGKDSSSGKQNEVNTTQNDIGIGNHWIDPTEVLRFDFVNNLTFSGNGQGATYQHSGHYTVDAASFTIKEVQGNGGSVTVFVQVFNADDDQNYTNDGPPLAIDVDKVTVTGDASYTKTLVYENGNVVGVVISGLNENATVAVNTTDELDRLVIKNYGGVTFTDTVNGHTTNLSGDNFTIGGVKSIILEPVSLNVTHDETAGFGAQLPNGQDDADPTCSSIPTLLKTAADAQSTVLGFAVSTGTASTLFTSARFGTDGAAVGGGLTYQLTKAGSQAFDGEDSGVRTTIGNKAVLLYTDGDIVWGRTADGQNVFALTIDNAGHLWVAQFAAIAHDVDGSTPADHDDTVSITTGLVFITATATDGDDDKAYAVSPAGLHINFQDDGLTAVADFATTNEGQSMVIDVKNNDLIGADGVDWSKVSHANAVGGTVTYLGDGKFSYTPNAGFDGNGKFTYTITDGDGDTSTATVSVKVEPVLEKPTIVSDLATNPLVIKEDGSETVTLTATAGATDVITQVEVTGLDATATYVINNVAVSAGSTSYTVTFDGTKQSEPVVIMVTPAQDSDVDLTTLSAIATAKDADHAGASDPGTTSNPVTVSIVVDAVLDEYAAVGHPSTQAVSEATTVRAIDLGFSLDFHETSFSAPSDQPFDTTPRDDGSETFTVTITVAGDVVSLQLAAGTLGTLTEVSGGTWTLTATRSNLAAAVASVQAIVPANFDGTISGTIAAVSTDITTDTEVETPDNSKTEQTNWSLVVNPSVATPALDVTAGLTDGRLVIKEDSDNTVTLTAGVAAGSDDVLKSATVTGLVSAASYIINGTPVTGTTTYTFSFAANTTTSLITISAASPQDGDADLGSLALTVTAADGTNPSVVTPSATTHIPVIVDAVLDEYVDATGTATPLAYSATAQTVSLGLTAAVMSTGFLHAMGSAGADTDGSESTTATITLNAAASLSLANGASISLAQTGPTTYTLTGTAAQVQDALTKVQVTVPGDFFGTVSGTVSTTSKEANTPASANSTEPDISDNTKSDPTPATFSITISNTTPETVDDTSALTVSEAALDLIKAGSDLAAGIKTGTKPTSPTETAVDTNGLRFKATGEDIISIKFANPNVTTPTFDNLASGTPHWTLSSDGRTMTLDFAGQTALILALTGASNITAGSTGDVTVTATLTDSFRHFMPTQALDVVLNGVTVVATDVSNDPTTGSVSVHIVDDVPAALLPSELILENKGVVGTSDQLTTGLNFLAGADGVGTVVFSVPGLQLGATSGETVAATDADGHLLTFNGQQLYLYYGGPTGTDTTLLVAKTLTGTVGYTVDVDPATGTYTFNPEAKISNGTEVTATTFKDAVGGGNTPFRLIADVGGSQDIVLSTASATTINTSNNKIGVGNGPTLANSDVIRFDLVNGAFIDQSGSFQYDHTHNLVQRWSQDISINSESADFTATAIIADTDSAFYGDTSGEQILDLSVSNIRIYNAAGTLLTEQDLQSQGISLQDTGNSIQINGMRDGYDYEIVTDAAHKFSAIEVQAVSSTSKFSLGLFNYGENSAGTPIELKHNVVGTDGDGDTVNGTIDLTLFPDTTAFTGSNPTPTSANDTFIGTSGVDTLNGLVGADILAGLAGNDMLNGGIGDDILYGGPGYDELTGGTGVDTFVIDPSALVESPTLADVILDYDFNNGMGDQVDLTALLDGISAANIGNYVRVVEAGPADAATDQLQVSTTGDAASFHTVALLNSDSGVKILYSDEQHHSQNASLP